MIILLSPAKSLDFESKFNCKNHTIPCFEKEVKTLVLELKKLSISDFEKIMKISPKLAELNFDRFQKFDKNFTLSNSRQALLAFDGDVYAAIAKNKFLEKDFAFAQQHLRILSGLYGILKPLDLIQPYRLEMGCNFKNLYNFWENKIAEKLNEESCKTLINLASEEYFSAINPQKISQKIINIIFKEKKNGALKIIGINAKKARGLMTNFAIKNKITKAEELKSFEEENYSFQKELSNELNWTFTRQAK